MMYSFLFYALSILSISFAAGIVFFRKPIYNLLSFLGISLCVFTAMVLLGAFALACIYVLIYAGAILVLFVFVIVLTRYDENRTDLFGIGNTPHFGRWFFIGFVTLGFVLSATLVHAVIKSQLLPKDSHAWLQTSQGISPIASLSVWLIKDYALGLWLAAFLILLAMLSLSTLAKRSVS